jgi:translation initiation factor IF-2
MSDTATSGDATVAPAETVGAPSAPAASTAASSSSTAPVPTFGTSRGSGLARGKRASNPATATKADAAPTGNYQPTAIQLVHTEREYKNPFAPETPIAPAPIAQTTAAASAAPEATRAASPAPRAEPASVPSELPAHSPATASEPARKAELNILPPEEQSRPAQSWESDSFSGGRNATETNARAGERPIFRTERFRQRDSENTAASGGENATGQTGSFRGGEPSREPRDRDHRQPRDPREAREPRPPREPRAFEKQPGTTPPIAEEKKSGGFFGWLKNLFGGESAATETPSNDTRTAASTGGERRFDREGRGGGRGGRHHRGGRGGRGQGGGFRGDNRGGQPRGEGQSHGSPQAGQGGGEHRFQGGHGGERDHHRGGRGGRGGRGQGRGFRGDRGPRGGGGEGRSDGGSSAAS